MPINKVLVVGATGTLGGKVVQELLRRGKQVRALVRHGSDSSGLQQQGVQIVRGDLTQPDTLLPALSGMDALITTAIGYAGRKKGDSLTAVDDLGNRNLIDAAAAAKLSLFVFTSILAADQAVDVPHFHQKKLTEDYLRLKGVPFVALRPGGFIDTLLSPSVLNNGSLRTMISPDAKASTLLSDDVACYLVMALDDERAWGKSIDLGADRPVSIGEIASLLTVLLSKEIRVSTPPPWLAKPLFAIIGLFNPFVKGLLPSVKFVESGKYVADLTVQQQLWGAAPTIEDTLTRWVDHQRMPQRSGGQGR